MSLLSVSSEQSVHRTARSAMNDHAPRVDYSGCHRVVKAFIDNRTNRIARLITMLTELGDSKRELAAVDAYGESLAELEDLKRDVGCLQKSDPNRVGLVAYALTLRLGRVLDKHIQLRNELSMAGFTEAVPVLEDPRRSMQKLTLDFADAFAELDKAIAASDGRFDCAPFPRDMVSKEGKLRRARYWRYQRRVFLHRFALVPEGEIVKRGARPLFLHELRDAVIARAHHPTINHSILAIGAPNVTYELEETISNFWIIRKAAPDLIEKTYLNIGAVTRKKIAESKRTIAIGAADPAVCFENWRQAVEKLLPSIVNQYPEETDLLKEVIADSIATEILGDTFLNYLKKY